MARDTAGAGPGRTAKVERTTKETSISVTVDLDGSGRYDVSTGIGFLDHMLEQLSRHSLIDITVRAKGDLHIDYHHTTEDTGIALGEAFSKALGERIGITRYGEALIPMDETLTQVALDASNRPYLIWKVNFTKPKLGEMDTELFKEWFQAFAQNAGICLHIENLYADNSHHTTEDTAIVIGQAVKKALGDFSGITRFGSALIPMDEALTRVAIDVSNRPYLIWKVSIPKPKLGEMDTELFKEWFQAFAQNAGVCLHIENLYAENSHHIVETCFKGLARALRQAVTPDERLEGSVASTKGSL